MKHGAKKTNFSTAGASSVAAAANQIAAGGDSDSVMASLMKDPAVLAKLQAKLGSIEGADSGYIESLPIEVTRRLKALKKLQASSVQLEVELTKQIEQLERDFAAKFAPLHAKRAAIISGGVEPTDEECEFESSDEDFDEDDEDGEEPDEAALAARKADRKAARAAAQAEAAKSQDGPVTGIPDFWSTVLQNCQITSEMIEPHDVAILEHLVDISLEHNADGFKVNFTFSPNDFFTNTVLSKTYESECTAEATEVYFQGPEYTKATGTAIAWKQGKDVTVKLVKKKQKKKAKGGKPAEVRTVVKAEPQPSFFNYFATAELNEDDEDDEDAQMQIEGRLMLDFELADVFKEKLIPNAVLWFTGEALEYENEDDDQYGGGDDDEEEDGEDGEDDEGGHGHHGHSHGGKACHGHGGDDEDDDEADPDFKPPAAGPGGKPAECKQS